MVIIFVIVYTLLKNATVHNIVYNHYMQHIDFFAIGDIVVEPFIRLKEASVHCNIRTDTCEICMRWGDKVPYDYAVLAPAVGNAPNAAVCAARLGLNAYLHAYTGDDENGKLCMDILKQEKVDTSFMVCQPGKKTNYHYVLWYESERTILVKHEDFDYTVPVLTSAPKWVYLSSLAASSLPYHLAIIEWLKTIPDAKLAFQPGTFQMQLGAEVLRDIYQKSAIFFCNKQEAARILKMEPSNDIKSLLENIQKLGPKIVIITDDRKGAYARDEVGNMWHMPMYPDRRPPLERTGAGDCFSASVTSALALGLPLTEALLWGPINAMEVVQEIGAQKGLLTRKKLEQYLKEAPADYKLTTL